MKSLINAAFEKPICSKNSNLGFRVMAGFLRRRCGRREMTFLMSASEKLYDLRRERTA